MTKNIWPFLLVHHFFLFPFVYLSAFNTRTLFENIRIYVCNRFLILIIISKTIEENLLLLKKERGLHFIL